MRNAYFKALIAGNATQAVFLNTVSKRRCVAKKWYSALFKENAYGFGMQALVFIAGVVTTVIFPNILGKDGFAYYSMVIGVVAFGMVFADFGIQNAVLRFIPEGTKKGTAWKYFRVTQKWKIALSLLTAIALFAGAEALAAVYQAPSLVPGFRVGAVFLFFYSLMTYYETVFISLKKTRLAFMLQALYQVGRIAFPIAIFYSFMPNYVGATIGVAAAAFLYVVPALIATLRNPALSGGKDKPIDYSALKGYMMLCFVAYLAYITVQWSDTLIIGLMKPASDVAVYRIAWLWATATALLFPFSQRVFISAHAYEDAERSRKVFGMSLKYGFVFAFLMISGIVAVAGQFLQLVYGSGFVDAYPIMCVLSLLTIEMTLNVLSSGLLLGKGKAELPTWISCAAAIGQIAMLLLLLPQYGLVAAAMGLVSIRVLLALLQAGFALRYISLGIPASYIYKPALCALLTIALLMPLRAYTFSLPAALACGVAVVAIYGLLSLVVKAVGFTEIVSVLHGSISR